jgi:hypothetical protein
VLCVCGGGGGVVCEGEGRWVGILPAPHQPGHPARLPPAALPSQHPPPPLAPRSDVYSYSMAPGSSWEPKPGLAPAAFVSMGDDGACGGGRGLGRRGAPSSPAVSRVPGGPWVRILWSEWRTHGCDPSRGGWGPVWFLLAERAGNRVLRATLTHRPLRPLSCAAGRVYMINRAGTTLLRYDPASDATTRCVPAPALRHGPHACQPAARALPPAVRPVVLLQATRPPTLHAVGGCLQLHAAFACGPCPA